MKKFFASIWDWFLPLWKKGWAEPKTRRLQIIALIALPLMMCCCLTVVFYKPPATTGETPTAIALAGGPGLATQTPYPTYTAYPTYTVGPTFTAIVVMITPESTSMPAETATITQTPTISPIPSNTLPPTATLDAMYEDKAPGIYLVGIDIGPGVWRSEKNGNDSCYWSRTTKTGDIIDNFLGASGGTMYLAASDFQVELQDECGVWTFLSK
jgi:hypothetical protein